MTPTERPESSDRPLWWWIVMAAAVVLLAIGAYLYWERATVPVVPPSAPAPPPPVSQTQAPAEAVIEHPVPSPPPALASLNESDASIINALATLIGAERVGNWFFADALVRRFVASVDNLSRPTVAMKVRVLKPISGPFVVDRTGEEIVIGAENTARYAPYVQTLERVDAKQLAGVYLRFYPWFQQAYEELGYPKGYFNDRLVAAIDHLLATPEPKEPPKLVQPKVLYQFADPELESLSAGQKALLRMGPDNNRRVKAKLRALRSEIARK